MRAARPFPFANRPRRHFAWLLWLAMLLPLAQGAATWHAMSHAAAAVSGGETDSDSKALHASSCALCLSAAALGNGAAPATPPGLVLLAASHAAPLAAALPNRAAVDWPAYRSRAPPSFIPC
jgi:hypothetical protein